MTKCKCGRYFKGKNKKCPVCLHPEKYLEKKKDVFDKTYYEGE